ncbi:LETM1-related biofilm-associated protein [Flavobacterium selenitireducens]|uniref:LETM1-related biofilm-associated protein n=1 Tax=Flavobacterium selenitireducens TaxID=2722704 RepID=UPI00168A61DC|nr:LETM1-related biofilm-associated protein [Flavobacterium selenitireducens]MBD3581410.1 hypothetical protein [Flavobacterium selenitireducens]
MINPSVHGWIDKYFIGLSKSSDQPTGEAEVFYREIRKTGFVYGHIISYYTSRKIENHGWLDEEVSKLALLVILHRLYVEIRKVDNREMFVAETIAFYDEMHPKGLSLLKKVLPGQPPSLQLESIIDERVQTNENIISKNFSHIVTNALLFIDVIAFQKFLESGSLPEKYLKNAEELIIGVVSLALQTKVRKSQYDTLLIRLFEASLRFGKFSNVSVSNLESLDLSFFNNPLERYYLLDLAGMSMWSDGVLENEERYFLYKIGEFVRLSDKLVEESMFEVNDFISKHKKEIAYFNYSNPVKHFYDHMTESVIVLIKRNRSRLVKEITQSGELVRLLAQSTQRDLDEKEKKRMRKQVLDICKTIPSLTIFLLPGGSLLLPILIKFIPQMLPSAFNENSDHEA